MPDIASQDALLALQHLVVAIAIGFLIGFEREWARAADDREKSIAGARTFALVSLTGALAGQVNAAPVIVAAALMAIAAVTVISYYFGRRDDDNVGMTTEIALLATFFLGLAAGRGYMLIAAIGGVSTAILLSAKPWVMRWAAAITAAELRAVLRFLAISVIILPVLPNQDFGPYGAINPREIWYMVVLISGLSFLGYALTKIFGPSRGVMLTGLFGGLASSTAATLSLSRFVRSGGVAAGAAAGGIIVANFVMLVRVGILLSLVGRDVLAAIWPSLGVGAMVCAGAAIWFSRGKPVTEAHVELGNPMELRPALFFAALLALIGLAAGFASQTVGDAGVYVVGLISGVADVDAVTLTVGRRAGAGELAVSVAGGAILIAVATNIAIKAFMAASIGGGAVGARVIASFAGATIAGAVTFFILQA